MSAAAAGAPRRLAGMFRRRLGRRLDEPFPEVRGNEVVPLARGAGFYERMSAAIDAARTSVDVEMYLWDGDDVGRRFAHALSRAARRGVRVRVLADAQGARDAFPLLRDVAAAGGDVRLFNPFRLRFWRRYFHRTHKKLLVLDGEVAFAGGAGFSLSWTRGKRRERPWHDRMYEFRGPVVAQFGQVFVADFERWDRGAAFGGEAAARGTDEDRGESAAAPDPWTEDTLPAPPPSRDAALRVLRGWPDRRDFLPAILAAVGRARERVWIGTPYFLPPRSLRRALYLAARRGVDVQVVVPSAEHANLVLYDAVRARYGRWLRRGVRLHEFPAAFYHAKTFVADRTLAVVGSSNLDSWSIRRNAELDVAVGDEPTVERIARLLAEDRALARPVTLQDARIGNLLREILVQIASALEDWL